MPVGSPGRGPARHSGDCADRPRARPPAGRQLLGRRLREQLRKPRHLRLHLSTGSLVMTAPARSTWWPRTATVAFGRGFEQVLVSTTKMPLSCDHDVIEIERLGGMSWNTRAPDSHKPSGYRPTARSPSRPRRNSRARLRTLRKNQAKYRMAIPAMHVQTTGDLGHARKNASHSSQPP